MPKKSIIIFFLFSLLFTFFNLAIFYPIFISNNITISFAIHPFNICNKYPDFWYLFKIFYIIFLLIAKCTVSYILVKSFFHLSTITPVVEITSCNSNLNMLIGYSNTHKKDIILPEKSLYQNILITGTIGSGKN